MCSRYKRKDPGPMSSRNTMFRLRVAQVMRPLMSRLPRGHNRLYNLLLGKNLKTYHGDAIIKQNYPKRFRIFYDRSIGSYVQADLGDWASRHHYFVGRYYDRLVPLVVQRILSGGGTFVDVGANRGIHTLAASRHLQNRGTVYAFEPNPATFRVLDAHLTINVVSNCRAFNLGLSDSPDTLSLNMFDDDHSGTCSFIPAANVVNKTPVDVVRMDQLVDQMKWQGPTIVKIDTEGYEHKVIMGMGELLDYEQLVVICEITDKWLQQAGTSAVELFDDMAFHGFKFFLPRVRFKSFFTEEVTMRQIDEPLDEFQYDVLFARDLPQVFSAS